MPLATCFQVLSRKNKIFFNCNTIFSAGASYSPAAAQSGPRVQCPPEAEKNQVGERSTQLKLKSWRGTAGGKEGSQPPHAERLDAAIKIIYVKQLDYGVATKRFHSLAALCEVSDDPLFVWILWKLCTLLQAATFIFAVSSKECSTWGAKWDWDSGSKV